MMPLLFGDTSSPLYGVLHQAQGTRRNAGIVICYPFGQEYMRSHRAFRQLALLLTRKGFDVFRFDYRGTGDSSGECDGVTASDWLDDIMVAVQELRETTNATTISLVGLRLGALLASAACGSTSTDIEQLVLWDPVLSGIEYQRELLEAMSDEVPNDKGVVSGNGLTSEGTLYYNGFSLSDKFLKSMATLDLRGTLPTQVTKVLHVVSHETPSFTELRSAWSQHPQYRYQLAPAPHDWNYVDDFGGILLPQPVIQSIVQWFDSEGVS
jgi:pimeloyl-ACP methyl ester carboxylesterase